MPKFPKADIFKLLNSNETGPVLGCRIYPCNSRLDGFVQVAQGNMFIKYKVGRFLYFNVRWKQDKSSSLHVNSSIRRMTVERE